MDTYKSFPRLIRCLDYCFPAGHSDDFRTLPRPIGSIAYIKQGSAEYFSECDSFRISSGEILFIPLGGTYISYWDEQPAELLGFHFSMPNSFETRYAVQKITTDEELLQDFEEAVRDELPNFRSYELFYKICGRLWSSLALLEQKLDPRLRPALDLLELEPERHITVGELSRLCHMSEPHFYHCFKASVGRAPIEYRTQLLILKAERLLGTTELSITEISDRLGFCSETYFRRIFKEAVGVSPREYRKTPVKQ